MNPAFIALLGALIGGILSASGSWLAQRVVSRSKLLSDEIKRRQELYGEFTDAAAQCYGEALGDNKPDFASLTKVYRQLARMRLLSSEAVLIEGSKIAHKILDTYADANRTPEEIRDFLSQNPSFDLFSDFGDACRTELADLHLGRAHFAKPLGGWTEGSPG